MTQFWRHPKFSILFDYARRVAAKTVRFAPFMTRRYNGSIWLGGREKDSRFLVYRSTVPTPSWVRRKRAWFIKKKSGFAVWNFLGTRKNPTSGAFWLRLFAQYSTVIRAVFSTSPTNFFYVPTRTLRHLHLRFSNNFYVIKLRTSKPPIGPYFSS